MSTDKRKTQLRESAQTSRDKKRKKGLKPMEIWIKPEHKPLVKAYLKTLACLTLIILTGCTHHLYEVNKRINGYKYIATDLRHLKSPDEFYRDGGGICNDFANAKAYEALKMGYAPDDIRFVIMAPKNLGEKGAEGHTVVQIGHFVLDSQNNHIKLASTVEGQRIKMACLPIVVEGIRAYAPNCEKS